MNNQKQKMELLGNAPVAKALLAMGIPTMIGMLINALYNLVDAYFVGGLGKVKWVQFLSFTLLDKLLSVWDYYLETEQHPIFHGY